MYDLIATPGAQDEARQGRSRGPDRAAGLADRNDGQVIRLESSGW